MYSFGLHFSFFNAHDSQVWSFDGGAEFLHILFIALELFDYDFFFSLSLISILSLSSEFLSSTCSSLLEWTSTVVFV
jgi:hypothetical protein